MKKLNELFLLIAIVAILATSCSVQEKKLSWEEIITLRDKAVEMLKQVPYRVTSNFQEFENRNQPATASTVQVVEIIQPDRQHILSEKRNDLPVKDSERILIGEDAHVKTPDGSWKQDNSKAYPRIGGTGVSGFSDYPVNGAVILDYLPKQIINSTSADCYQVVRRTKASGVQGENEGILEETFCFNREGAFVKTEIEMSGGISQPLYRTTTDFEYDPTIKIEAPIK